MKKEEAVYMIIIIQIVIKRRVIIERHYQYTFPLLSPVFIFDLQYQNPTADIGYTSIFEGYELFARGRIRYVLHVILRSEMGLLDPYYV